MLEWNAIAQGDLALVELLAEFNIRSGNGNLTGTGEADVLIGSNGNDTLRSGNDILS
ncbi:MAG: hypothetical protein LBF61_12085 [Azoarcus sp.]|nr:hypothetical protein [Azoarcus sp.]